MSRLAVVLVFLYLLAGGRAARAQSAASVDTALMQRLLQRIDELENRVRQLKSTPITRGSVPELAAASPSPTLAVAEDLAADASTKPGIRFQGFAETGYAKVLSGHEPNHFGLGQLDLFVTSQLHDKVSVLVEAVIEHGHNNEAVLDLERALLQLRPNDYLHLDVGRYHSTLGYFNDAYHHGTWLQTAIGRPLAVHFEDDGGVLPVHNVGLRVSGRIPSRSLGLGYVAEVGNGRSYFSDESGPVQTTNDNNATKSLNLGLSIKPDRVYGLQAGFNWYRDTLASPQGPLHQRILTAHAIYNRGRNEWMNEAFWMRHTVAGRSTSIPMLYSQFSRRYGAWRPYMRYEATNPNSADPVGRHVLEIQGRQQLLSIGTRYDFAEFAAFKAQIERVWRASHGSATEARAQFAFTF